jgi:membrane fusion protein, multidrug efflux system
MALWSCLSQARLRPLLVGSAILAGLGACDQKSDQSNQAAPAPPPAVVVSTVAERQITPTASFTGRIEAVGKVELRARVQGFLEKQNFADGSVVHSGDLLFLIEQAPYQAQVTRDQAAVESAKANKVNTGLQLTRAQELVKGNAIAAAQVDQRKADDQIAGANVSSAEAALEQAQIDLSYTEIKAPITGRVSRAAYTIGNLVNPQSGTLATIVSQDPMYVVFPVTQRQLLEVRRRSKDSGEDASHLAVKVILADSSTYDQSGTIDFVGVQVSQSTDTVDIRATIPNADGLLIDGQLITAQVQTSAPKSALVIPQRAIQADQEGLFVLTVDADKKVQVQRVEVDQGPEGLSIIKSGLKAGDKVIVDGVARIFAPGSPVQVAEPGKESGKK